jgi:hypothetical protein
VLAGDEGAGHRSSTCACWRRHEPGGRRSGRTGRVRAPWSSRPSWSLTASMMTSIHPPHSGDTAFTEPGSARYRATASPHGTRSQPSRPTVSASRSGGRCGTASSSPATWAGSGTSAPTARGTSATSDAHRATSRSQREGHSRSGSGGRRGVTRTGVVAGASWMRFLDSRETSVPRWCCAASLRPAPMIHVKHTSAIPRLYCAARRARRAIGPSTRSVSRESGRQSPCG